MQKNTLFQLLGFLAAAALIGITTGCGPKPDAQTATPTATPAPVQGGKPTVAEPTNNTGVPPTMQGFTKQ